MKNLTNHLIAIFLLLCFTVTIVPLNFLHHHDHSEEALCDINDKIHSDDACHFSLYHNQLEEKHCDHKAHITDNEIECEFCKILNSQRDNYLSPNEETKYANHNFSILLAVKFTHYNKSYSDLFYNKGPPLNS